MFYFLFSYHGSDHSAGCFSSTTVRANRKHANMLCYAWFIPSHHLGAELLFNNRDRPMGKDKDRAESGWEVEPTAFFCPFWWMGRLL